MLLGGYDLKKQRRSEPTGSHTEHSGGEAEKKLHKKRKRGDYYGNIVSSYICNLLFPTCNKMKAFIKNRR